MNNEFQRGINWVDSNFVDNYLKDYFERLVSEVPETTLIESMQYSMMAGGKKNKAGSDAGRGKNDVGMIFLEVAFAAAMK